MVLSGSGWPTRYTQLDRPIWTFLSVARFCHSIGKSGTVKLPWNSSYSHGRLHGDAARLRRGGCATALQMLTLALFVCRALNPFIISSSLACLRAKSSWGLGQPELAPSATEDLEAWWIAVASHWPVKEAPKIISLMMLVMRFIWIERNNRVFKNVARPEASVIDVIMAKAVESCGGVLWGFPLCPQTLGRSLFVVDICIFVCSLSIYKKACSLTRSRRKTWIKCCVKECSVCKYTEREIKSNRYSASPSSKT